MKIKVILFFLLAIFYCSFGEENLKIEKVTEEINKIEDNYSKRPVINIRNIYNSLKISDKLSYEIFQQAYLGYLQIQNKNPGLLIIIDYSRSSSEERFFVINLEDKKLVYHTRVAHSKNSGLEIPFQFSDNPNSYESSLGFFLTMGEYNGAFGHSLRLKGLEENINSNAEDRAIVIHGGDIVEESYIKKYGFAGRSLGCPVLPYSKSTEIIEYIKNGRVIFIYGKDDNYLDNSTYLKDYISVIEATSKVNEVFEGSFEHKNETEENTKEIITEEKKDASNITETKKEVVEKKENPYWIALGQRKSE